MNVDVDVARANVSLSRLTSDGRKLQLRLAFVCAGDPEDALTWSGTPFNMLQALKQEFDVALVVRRPWLPLSRFVRRGVRRLTGGAIDLYWWPLWTRITAYHTISQIAGSGCDAVIAVAATPICAAVAKRLPAIFVSDATLGRMGGYNPRFIAMWTRLKRQAADLESQAIQQALFAAFPSDWARVSAIRDHDGLSERVVQIPWGANMVAKRIVAPEERSPTEWRLLFVGTSWQGKGGSIVLDAVEEIRRRGWTVSIDIVGSSPRRLPDIDGVVFHGFLDKRDPSQRERLEELFASAHLFFLPTQFEALGIVFAEAASYAVPAVSYATGGVPAMVDSGATGVLLEEQAPPTAFADTIIELLSDRPRYIEMSHAALRASKERLNWTAWARRIREEAEARLAYGSDRA